MNFLDDYALYSSGNEAPPDYHVWAGFAALSACCGPHLWKDMGKFNIQPNLYIIFVGRPGIRKTTAMDIAKKLAVQIKNIPMAPVSATKESLLKDMSEEKSRCKKVFKYQDKPRTYTHMSIFASELVDLVQAGGDPITYISILTNIYDPQPNFDGATIARGKIEIPYPYVTILGCMTPEITGNLIRENALSGGFSRRCLFIYADRNAPPVAEPEDTPEQKAAKDRLIQRGREIQKLVGEFKFSDLGRKHYKEWYDRNHYEAERATSTAQQNFYQSKAGICLKVAMLCKLAHSDELIIDEEEMSMAINAVTDAQRHIDSVFAGVGRNPHAATLAGIRTYIEAACQRGPHYVLKKRLHAQFLAHASVQEIDNLLKDMAEAEQIRFVTIKATNGQVLQAISSLEYAAQFEEKQPLKPMANGTPTAQAPLDSPSVPPDA